MKNISEDKRTKKTKINLKQSLIKLLKDKRIQDITVIELSTLANVHRGTFYFHYKDIYDLLEESESDILNDIKNIFKTFNSNNLEKNLFKTLKKLNDYIDAQSELFDSLLNKNKNTSFSKKLKDIIKHDCLLKWVKCNDNIFSAKLTSFYLDFITSGYIGIISLWLRENKTISTYELSYIMIDMAYNGFSIKE